MAPVRVDDAPSRGHQPGDVGGDQVEETFRGRQRLGDMVTQPDQERSPPVPAVEFSGEPMPGRGDRDPLHQCGLAGAGITAQQDPRRVAEGLFSPDRSAFTTAVGAQADRDSSGTLRDAGYGCCRR